MRSRFLCKMLNHCSRLFHPRTVDRSEVTHEAGMGLKPRLNLFALMHLHVVHHEIDASLGGGRACSSCERKVMNSTCRLRVAVQAETLPVRVSKAANKCNAPLRFYSCSRRVGRPGRDGRVGAKRGRGWRLVFSSTHKTSSFLANGRVERSTRVCTSRAKLASRELLQRVTNGVAKV